MVKLGARTQTVQVVQTAKNQIVQIIEMIAGLKAGALDKITCGLVSAGFGILVKHLPELVDSSKRWLWLLVKLVNFTT